MFTLNTSYTAPFPNFNNFNKRVKDTYTRLFNSGINQSFINSYATNWTSCDGDEPVLCEPRHLHSEEISMIRYLSSKSYYSTHLVFQRDMKQCFKLWVFRKLYPE